MALSRQFIGSTLQVSSAQHTTVSNATTQSSQFIGDLLQGLSDSIIPILVLITGVLIGIIIGRLSYRLLTAVDIPGAVEGTTFERTVNRLGTSTVDILSALIALFVIALAIGLSLSIEGVLGTQFFLISQLPTYLLQVFVAALVLIVGLIIGDKAEVEIREEFEDVKLPEVNLIPRLVKYTILFAASLIALSQIGVETDPLLVLFGGYVFAIVVLGGIALKDLLSAGAAGIYLLLSQPYSIGDTIDVDGHRGIVQEVDLFVTRIENDNEEFILPNHLVLSSGIVRVRS
jgi:small-conductance mechanosensitive channel